MLTSTPLVIAVKAQQKLAPIAASVRNLKIRTFAENTSFNFPNRASSNNIPLGGRPRRIGMGWMDSVGLGSESNNLFPFPFFPAYVACPGGVRSILRQKGGAKGKGRKRERRNCHFPFSPSPSLPPPPHFCGANKKGGHMTDLSISVAF